MHAPLAEQDTRHWINAAYPPSSTLWCELKVRDRDGLYRLPFPVTCERGVWRNARWGNRIEATVVSWRGWLDR